MARGDITVLNAGLRVAGVPRGPNARPLAGPGAALTQAGNAAADLGATIARVERDKQTSEAAVDASARLNELSDELEQDTDYSTALERYNQRVEEIRGEIEGGLTAPGARRRFSLRFDQLADVRRQRVRRTAAARQRDAHVAALTGELAAYAREAGQAGTQEARAAVDALAADAIDAAAETGALTRTQAERLTQRYLSDSDEADFMRLLAADPSAAQTAIGQDGSYPNLDPIKRAELEGRANRAVRIEQNRVKAEQGALRSDLKSDVREIRDVARAGLPVAPELVAEAREKARALNDADMTRALDRAVGIVEFQNELALMSPADAQAEVSRLEGSVAAGATGDDAAKVKAGRQVLSRMRTELSRDPLSYGVRTGAYDVPALNAQDASVEALEDRRRLALAVADNYGIAPKFFTDEERTQFSEALNSGSPQQQLVLVSRLSGGFGSDAPRALAELRFKQPAAAQLGVLVARGPEYQRVALDGFRGIQALKDKTVEAPKKEHMREIVQRELGDALDSRLSSVRRQIMDAAEKIYAARALDRNITEWDPNLFAGAVREAAGEISTTGGTRGGIGNYQGRNILLPKHLSSSEFGDVVRGLTEGHLTTLSETGGAPVHRSIHGNQKRVDPSDFEGAYFVTVGDGLYQVSMTDPTIWPRFLLDEQTGGFYVLDLSDPGELPPPSPFTDVASPFGGEGGAP